MSTAWNASNTLTISSTGNTLETMYTDVADDTVMSKSLAEGYPEYFVDGIKGRYVNIATGATLTVGDESDFSYREVLYQKWSGTNYQTRLNVQNGGTLHVYGNVDIILNYGCAANQYADYSYWDGNFLLSGSDDYQPNIRGARNWQFRAISVVVADMQKQYWILNKVKMGECLVTPVCNVVLETHVPPTMSFTNITHVNDLYNAYTSFMSCIFYTPVLDMPTIDNLVYSGSKPQYATMISYGVRWLNTFFSSSLNTYAQTLNGYERAYTYNIPTYSGTPWQQKKVWKVGQFFTYMFENTDINIVYANHTYNTQAMLALFKNYPNINNKRCINYYGAQALCWHSDNVFAIQQLDAYNGQAKKVYLLDLTIVDKNNNPIDDVIVDVRQTNTASLDTYGKYEVEKYMCRTDETGKIIAMNGIGGVLLANQIKISTSETLYTISSGSNDTYHEVKIFKDGYKGKTLNIEMDADKTMRIKLDNLYSSDASNKIQGN